MVKKVAIFGLGKSGAGSAKYFASQGYDVFAWDDSAASVEKFSVPSVQKIHFNDWPWGELESLILAPGIPMIFPEPHAIVALARKNNVEVICDIEVLFRNAAKGAKFIGITGTNGKSTTTALTHHVLKECGVNTQIGGNIGIAALELDLKKPSVFVIEVSSYQLDLLKNTRFDIGILLNITPDHLDRYGSFERYVESKKQIFNNQNQDCTAIICVDQDITAGIASELKTEAKIIEYRTADLFKDEEFHYLPGEHNRQNIIAAFMACYKLGLKSEDIIAAIKTFPGLDHRIKRVLANDVIKFINDSKATNAEATEPALKTFPGCFWMAGGVPKEGGISKLEKYFAGIAHAVFYGQAGPEFASTYKAAGFNNFTLVKTFKEAFELIANLALKAGKADNQQKTVLLSPACASFDEFNNYEERGHRFREFSLKFAAENNLKE